MPSSNFVDFIHCASRICLGQNAKALVSMWKQICPLKINIFTLNAPISTNKVSIFKLAIEVCFENYFGLIHAIFLLLGSTKSVYCFLGHPVYICIYIYPSGWRKSPSIMFSFFKHKKPKSSGFEVVVDLPKSSWKKGIDD